MSVELVKLTLSVHVRIIAVCNNLDASVSLSEAHQCSDAALQGLSIGAASFRDAMSIRHILPEHEQLPVNRIGCTARRKRRHG